MSPNNSDDKFPTFRRIAVKSKIVMNKSKIVMKKIGKGLLVLLIILALAHGIMSAIAGHQLEAKLQDLKAKGEPIALAELGKPKVPDAENAAPVYARVFSILAAKEHDLAAKEHHPDRSVVFNLLDPIRRKADPGVWEATRKGLTKCQAVFPLIEEATSKPRCQFPIKWEEGLSATYPQLGPLRTTAAILAARAMLQARNGDIAGACHSIELGFKVSKALEEQPMLISQLVRMSAISIQTRALRYVMAQGGMTEAQARDMYDLLGGIDLMPGYVGAMQTERMCGIWAYDYARKFPKLVPAMLSGGDQDAPGTRIWMKPLIFLWRPVSYIDEQYYLALMNKMVDTADVPYRDIAAGRVKVDDDPKFPRYAVMANILLPVFSRGRMLRDGTTADIAGARIALALTAYKGRFGSYPTSLAEPRSKLGWAIPSDPFSGKDFVYRRQGAGFLLYSIGQNLKDDGARALRGRYYSDRYDYKDENSQWVADIIWRMSR